MDQTIDYYATTRGAETSDAAIAVARRTAIEERDRLAQDGRPQPAEEASARHRADRYQEVRKAEERELSGGRGVSRWEARDAAGRLTALVEVRDDGNGWLVQNEMWLVPAQDCPTPAAE